MIGSHKWQGGQCEKLSRWVPKAPHAPPSSDAEAHKLAAISGVQPASDLSLLFTGGKEKIIQQSQHFFSSVLVFDVHYLHLHFQVLQWSDIYRGSTISRTSTDKVIVDFLQFSTFTRSYKSTNHLCFSGPNFHQVPPRRLPSKMMGTHPPSISIPIIFNPILRELPLYLQRSYLSQASQAALV